MSILIESERIYLRDITEEDASDMYELDSDPLVHKYLGKNPVTTIEQTMAIIKDIQGQYERNNLGRSAIIEKSSGAFVGWAGLKIEDRVRDFTYYDVGYRLKQKHWYKGLGTEAAQLSLAYGFETRGFDKICGAADVDNLGSNKILSRIGLHHEGTFFFKETECNWYCLDKEAYLANK
jgi:ribosomal-protein-alanine N-acetyltransferase